MAMPRRKIRFALAWWLGVGCGMGAVGVWIGVGAGLYVSAGMLLCFLYQATRATAAEDDALRVPRAIAPLPRH